VHSAKGKKTIAAMSRIEGQIRGIAKMIAEDRYCIDIVTQIEAARAALARVESELLRGHLQHCVHEAMSSKDPANRERVIEELVSVFRR
jgi:DNA-binding FrmR family transcriptional regulator